MKKSKRVRRICKVSENFWAHLKLRDGCWEFQGARDAEGYGILRVGKVHKRAHVYAWAMKHGRWPEKGMCVCHTCDNPSCCRPSHLWLGTHAENMADKARKGRVRSGSGKERKSL